MQYFKCLIIFVFDLNWNMTSCEDIAKQFCQVYYEKYKGAAGVRGTDLASLYGNDSCLSFEGSNEKGVNAIRNKLNALSFKSINHSITCMDHQLIDSTTLLIIVIGMLKTDEDPPQSFSQTFILKATQNQSFYLKHDVLSCNFT